MKAAPDIDALLSAHTKSRPGGQCLVGLALAKMDAPTRAKIMAALDDRDRFGAEGLGKVLRALGHDMSRAPVERHRRGDCLCPR